jgi:aspartyl/asparaginyl-tRNA synthetase
MMTVDSPYSGPATPAAAMFEAPGRPRPLARRLAIHNRVVRRIRDFFLAEGFNEVPVTALADHPARIQLQGMLALGFEAVWCESEIMPPGGRLEPRHLRGFKLMEAAHADLPLSGLVALQQALLKFVAADLGADLLGGRDVTRLDRMLRFDHPCLEYEEALAILRGKGWDLQPGQPLHMAAKATLLRHCNNLPVQVVHEPRPHRLAGTAAAPAPSICEGVEYILPYAGVTMEGEVLDGQATFSLDLGRLLQYLMGLEKITDTLIDPMDRIAQVMRGVPHGTGLRSISGLHSTSGKG